MGRHIKQKGILIHNKHGYMYVFLFNDLLLLTKQEIVNKKHFKYVESFALSSLVTQEDAKEKADQPTSMSCFSHSSMTFDSND